MGLLSFVADLIGAVTGLYLGITGLKNWLNSRKKIFDEKPDKSKKTKTNNAFLLMIAGAMLFVVSVIGLLERFIVL